MPMSPQEFHDFCKTVLRDIAVFHYAVRTKKRADTAERLDVSPQWVGQVIRELEESMRDPLNGGALIDHSIKRIEVSDAGKLVYDFTAKLFDLSSKLVDDLHRVQHGGELRLSIVQSAWVLYGPNFKSEFNRLLPSASIREDIIGGVDYPQRIVEAVSDGKSDIGITSFLPDLDDRLVFQPFEDREFVAVFSPKYQHLPKRSPIKLDRIVSADPALKVAIHHRSVDSPLTNLVISYLRRNEADPGKNRFAEHATIEDIKSVVKSFPEIMAILPSDTVQKEGEQGILKIYRLDPAPPPYTWGMIYRAGSSRIAVQRFIECARPLFKSVVKKTRHRNLRSS